jgi:hypothetical protein
MSWYLKRVTENLLNTKRDPANSAFNTARKKQKNENMLNTASSEQSPYVKWKHVRCNRDGKTDRQKHQHNNEAPINHN